MPWNATLTQLNTLLAQLVPQQPRAQRYVLHAGMQAGNIAFVSSANDNWFNILTEADHQGKVVDLIDAVRAAYPQHPDLIRLREALTGKPLPLSPVQPDPNFPQTPAETPVAPVLGPLPAIQQHLENGRLAQALDALKPFTQQPSYSHLHGDVVGLKQQLAANERHFNQNLIGMGEYNQVRARVTQGILSLLEELKDS